MDEVIAENGKVVTDEMVEAMEVSLEHDEWPDGWKNVGEIVVDRLPSRVASSIPSIKAPRADENGFRCRGQEGGDKR